MMLVLTHATEARRWPFYGKAIETVRSLRLWGVQEWQKAEDHLKDVARCLAQARGCVRDLEHDEQVLLETWPVLGMPSWSDGGGV